MHLFDVGHDGKICVADLEKALKAINHAPSDDAVAVLVDKLDVDHDGFIRACDSCSRVYRGLVVELLHSSGSRRLTCPRRGSWDRYRRHRRRLARSRQGAPDHQLSTRTFAQAEGGRGKEGGGEAEKVGHCRRLKPAILDDRSPDRLQVA